MKLNMCSRLCAKDKRTNAKLLSVKIPLEITLVFLLVVFCHHNKAPETEDFQQSHRDFGEINHILTYRDRIILHLLHARVHTHACIHRVAIGKGGRKGERLHVLQKGSDVMSSSIATRSLAFSLYSLSSVPHKGVISMAWNVCNSF